MIKDGAIADLRRVLTRIGNSPINDPRGEHEAMAMEWLLCLGRCLIVGCDLSDYGYPRPVWAARGINYAHNAVQPAIARAWLLREILTCDSDEVDEDGNPVCGYTTFGIAAHRVLPNRMNAWLTEVGVKHAFNQSVKELGICNKALWLGKGIYGKDCKMYDDALCEHVGLLQSLPDCDVLMSRYRRQVAAEYQGALPWWLAGGLAVQPPCFLRPQLNLVGKGGKMD